MLLTSCFCALQKEKEASQDLEVVRAEVANLKEAVKSAEVGFLLLCFLIVIMKAEGHFGDPFQHLFQVSLALPMLSKMRKGIPQ